MPVRFKLICIMTAVFLTVLVGCTPGREADTPRDPVRMGRYAETEITPDTGEAAGAYAMGLFTRGNGAVDYFTLREDALFHFKSNDSGASWDTADTSWYHSLLEQYDHEVWLSRLAVCDSGDIACVLMDEMNNIYFARISGGQAAEKITLSKQEDGGKNGYVLDFALYGTNSIALSYESDQRYLLTYDLSTGNLLKQTEVSWNILPFIQGGYAVPQMDSDHSSYKLYQYDFEGRELAQYPFDYQYEQEYSLCEGNGQLYLRTEKGVVKCQKEQSDEQLIMDAAMYSFGSPVWETVDFKYMPDSGQFFMLQKNREDGSEKIYRYSFDASLPSQASEELRIFTLYDCSTLRQAISVFRVQHPEWKISLEIGLPEGHTVTKDDVVRVLNTELLAKKGADIYLLDGLPIQAYLDKRVFADLSDIALADEYFQNVITAYGGPQGICAVPVRYKIPLLAGDKALVDSMKDLDAVVNTARRLPQRPDQRFTRQDTIEADKRPLALINLAWDPVKLFMGTYQNTFFNSDGTINESTLKKYLSNTKELYQKGYSDKAGYYEGDDIVGWETVSFSPEDFYGERSMLGIANALDFKEFSDWAWATPENSRGSGQFSSPSIYTAPLCGEQKNVFFPAVIAAVNEFSDQKDMAREFVSTMLSEEVQRPSFSEGFPVNRQAFKQAYEESISKESIRYETDMEQLAGSLTTPVTVDETVLGAILDEVKPYYNDEETLDEAVGNISAKLRTYLAEKS